MKSPNKVLRSIVLSAVLGVCSFPAFSQFTITKGKSTIEFSGGVSMFYNQRFLKPNEEDNKKNRFNIRDAQLQIEGIWSNKIEYRFQFDIADIIAGANDPENPGLMDAWVKFKGLKAFDVQLGYGILPYSLSSMTSFSVSPYWQRPEITRGNIFSRRDAGITLSKSLWNQQINLYAGVYTGQGEFILQGDNDPSGKPEYMFRADFSYPSRFRYQDLDVKCSPKPMFSIGLNGRYAQKYLSSGLVMPSGSVGQYGLKTLNGEKWCYGFDARFQYKGFSAQFEMHQIKGRPGRADDPLLQGLKYDLTNGYFMAGGWYAQASYFIKPVQVSISGRFEQLDISDLIKGNSQRISLAASYRIMKSSASIKAQYWHNLKDESIDVQTWTDQLRIGVQYFFR